MWSYWLYRIIPSLITAGILGGAGYAKLYFDHKWPFWGRTNETTVTVTSEKREDG